MKDIVKFFDYNLRYNKFSEHLKNLFGEKVWKISVDAGFKCPPQAKCIYCYNPSFVPETARRKVPLKEQILKGMEIIRNRRKVNKFIVYFQAFTNTYGDIEFMRKVYYEALNTHPDIVGISIGTRSDTVGDEVLELLYELNKKTYLWVELGLQSANDKTMEITKRGHNVKNFEEAVFKLKEKNIRVMAHVIIGLPGDTYDDWMNTAFFLNKLKIDGVKIHPLHIVKYTELENWYREGKYKPLEMEEYINAACDFIERLEENILIARLTGEAPFNLLVAPDWCKNKMIVLNKIERELEKRESFQGKYLEDLKTFTLKNP
ncbi:MAG: TIGR01212 family radical SAM protein [candidate division WOR-3 bacterium]